MSVTYLFGAGASAASLPIVNAIPEKYSKFIKDIIGLMTNTRTGVVNLNLDIEEPDSEKYWQIRLVKLLRYYEDGIVNHASVDTYAKKLYLTNKNSLKFYKLCLSIFFGYEQIINGPDKRYDLFYASLLKENVHAFPENVRILSWNYDNQFEIAYADYLQSDSLLKAKEELGIITKNDPYSHNEIFDGFSILKMNGTTTVIEQNHNNIKYFNDKLSNRKRQFDQNDLKSVVELYKEFNKEIKRETTMSFAWEGDIDGNDIITSALNRTHDTKTLVVIGYSFPYFNRDIDRAIFSNMTQLSKVYIQDKYPESLVQKVRELCDYRDGYEARTIGVDIVPFANVDSFLIPNELN